MHMYIYIFNVKFVHLFNPMIRFAQFHLNTKSFHLMYS